MVSLVIIAERVFFINRLIVKLCLHLSSFSNDYFGVDLDKV